MFKSVHDHSVVYRLTAPTQTLTLEQDHAFICQAVLGSSAGLLGAALLPHLHGMAKLATPFSFADYEVANCRFGSRFRTAARFGESCSIRQPTDRPGFDDRY
jgi:hypothetical protein